MCAPPKWCVRPRAAQLRLASAAAGASNRSSFMMVSAALVSLLLSQAPAPASARRDLDLLDAAKLGELARTTQLLTGGGSVDTADRRGFTLLMWASAGGHVELVRGLLERGAAPDRRAADGTTALMLAASNGFPDVVRLLLARGVNVAALRGGVTARQLAVARGQSA